MMTYEQAQDFIKGLRKKPKTKAEYEEWWERNKVLAKEIGMPPNPEEYYKNNK